MAQLEDKIKIYIDEDDKNNIEETKKYSKEALEEISNLNYFIINKDTDEIYTNTECKTAEEFQSKYQGECDVKISSNNYNVSYSKILIIMNIRTQM